MTAPSVAPLLRSTTMHRIETCERIIGYRFRRPRYLREALTTLHDHNQRLALVGDKAADVQLVARWYDDKKRPAPSEWQLVRNTLVCNRNLAEVGMRVRIQDCTLTHCDSSKKIATTMEAIIGAVWLDSKRDYGAVNAVLERLGLTKHALLRSPKTSFTTNQPPREIHNIQSSRSLPDRFFVGHHVGLIQLLFRHSQSFNPLSRHEPAGEAPTDLGDTLSAPHITSETAQERTAARIAGRHKHRAREPSPSDTTSPPKRQAPAQVHATGEQINAEHDDSALRGALPVRQPVNLGDHSSGLAGRHDEPTGWHDKDTEWERIRFYEWAFRKIIGKRPRPRKPIEKVLLRLRAHREILRKLPGRSLKNMPDGFPTDGVYLMTRSADDASDRLLALQALELHSHYKPLSQEAKRMHGLGIPMKPEEKRLLRRLSKHNAKIWRERLNLWLPQGTHQHQVPVSLPDSGQTSPTSPETPQSGSTASAAVDSTRASAAEQRERKRPHRPGSVLWTTHTAQHESVDWKNYLSKPTSENQQNT